VELEPATVERLGSAVREIRRTTTMGAFLDFVADAEEEVEACMVMIVVMVVVMDVIVGVSGAAMAIVLRVNCFLIAWMLAESAC